MRLRTIIPILFIAASAAAVTITAKTGKGYLPKKAATPKEVVPEPYPPTIWGIELNEGTGSTITASAGPNATISGGHWITGASGSGGAYDSDGDTTGTTDSAVTFGANKITVTCWLKSTGWGAAPGVILQSGLWIASVNSWRIYDDEGAISVGMTGDTATSFSDWQVDSGFADNVWFHLAVVFDGSVAAGNATVYINGASVAVTPSGTSRDGTSNFADYTVKILDFVSLDDQIDDVRIYSGALSAAQISQIYLNPR